MGHPEFVHILRLRGLAGTTGVGVHVDEPGHHVHAGPVDLPCVALRLGWLIGPSESTTDPDDSVSLYDDIHRTSRGRPCAVDDGHSANDQPIVRSPTFVRAAAGRLFHAPAPSTLLGGKAGRQPERDSQYGLQDSAANSRSHSIPPHR